MSVPPRERQAAPRPAATATRPLRILVTNDDGVGAPGIDALVERLRQMSNTEVTVIAPATNQSGSGEKSTTTPLTVTNATTAHGYPARAVNGYPVDAVLLGVLKLLPARPDLVVSGINLGQNIGEFVDISGTVGAARASGASRHPGTRGEPGLRRHHRLRAGGAAHRVLGPDLTASLLSGHPPVELWNLNLPSCATGSVRGLAIVPLGRSSRVTGYSTTATGTYQATVEQRNPFASDCTSTKTALVDDIDAMSNGFISLTQLDIDGTADRDPASSALGAIAG